jgi:hypothetical protein
VVLSEGWWIVHGRENSQLCRHRRRARRTRLRMTLGDDVEVGEEVLCGTMSDFFSQWSHFGLIIQMTLNRQTPSASMVERVKPRCVPTQSRRAKCYKTRLPFGNKKKLEMIRWYYQRPIYLKFDFRARYPFPKCS